MGIVQDGDNAGWKLFEKQIKLEISNLLESKYDIEYRTLVGDFTYEKSQENLEEFMSDSEIDYVIASGVETSNTLALWGEYGKPCHASFIIEPELVGLEEDVESSGVDNFSYTNSAVDPYEDIRVFDSIYDFEKLGVLAPFTTQQYADLFNDYFDKLMAEMNKPYELIYLQEFEKMIGESGVDAIYIANMGNLSDDEVSAVIDKIHDKGIPTFALDGRPTVELGAFAGYAADDNFDHLARRVAINLSKVLMGENPKNFRVKTLAEAPDFVVNSLAAQKLNYYPSFDLLAEADVINVTEDISNNSYSLRKVIIDALSKNLNIKVSDFDVFLADQDIKAALSNYFPQGNITLSGTAVDEGIHTNQFAAQAPFNLTSGLNLNQSIFSVPIISNLVISKLSKQVTQHGRDQTELDVIFEAAQAYLNILLAKTNVRIQNDNVSVTRTNLNIVDNKVRLGYSGETDKLRWESQFALNKIDLNNALAQMNSAKFNLNRYLNNDIDEGFNTEEVDLADRILMVSDDRITKWIDDVASLNKFSDFLVQEAFKNLPEIKRIESTIAVQEKAKKWQKAAFIAPDVSAGFGLNYSFYNTGPNSEMLTQDRPFWNSGVTMRFPLSAGGSNFIQKQRIDLNISQLHYRLEDLNNVLELQIRSNLEQVGASFNQMILSREAAESARQNLSIAQNNYSNGTVNITYLIDVQNTTLQAEQLEASSLYTFYINFLAVERSIGFFYSLATESEKNDFVDRLDAYMLSN